MRTGRPTEKQKNEMLKIRVAYEMVKYLKSRANREEVTVSEYVRRLIDEDMKNYYR